MNIRTAAILSALLLASCGQDERKMEADRVLRRVDKLIAADRAEKETPLAQLEAESCTDEKVCTVKRACADAFRPLVESQRLQAEVRAAMRDGKDAAELTRKLDAAEAANREAAAKMDPCLKASDSARRAYRL